MIPEFLKPFFIAWFFTTNEPIQEWLADVCVYLRETTASKILIHIIDTLYAVLSCPYCLTFWLTLAWTLNIWCALPASFTMWIIKKTIFKEYDNRN